MEVPKNKIRALSDWVTICDGIEVCEFRHRSESVKDSRERLHFVVRKEIARRPEAAGKLLFEEDFPHYRYSIYVTDLDLPTKEI